MKQYIRSIDVAERYGVSKRSVHELTRKRRIPFRILPGSKPCLFRLDELDRWDAGAYESLEVRELSDGGIAVVLVPPIDPARR